MIYIRAQHIPLLLLVTVTLKIKVHGAQMEWRSPMKTSAHQLFRSSLPLSQRPGSFALTSTGVERKTGSNTKIRYIYIWRQTSAYTTYILNQALRGTHGEVIRLSPIWPSWWILVSNLPICSSCVFSTVRRISKSTQVRKFVCTYV